MLGRLFLKILPWWFFAFAALCFLPLTWSMVTGTLAARVEAEFARDMPAPPLTPLAQFSKTRINAPLDEVHLSGKARIDTGPWERVQKGVNFSYLVVEQWPDDQTTAPRYVLIYFESYLTDLTLERLAAQTDAQGRVILRGFVSSRGISLPPADWLRGAVPNGQLQAIILPYFGDRSAAIDEVTSDSMLVTVIAGLFNAVFFVAAFIKFRAWRQRAAAKRVAVSPKPKGRKWGAAVPQGVPSDRVAPVKSPHKVKQNPKDVFADSPIQSAKKGWF